MASRLLVLSITAFFPDSCPLVAQVPEIARAASTAARQPEEIGELIRQLGSDLFEQRMQAENKLASAGIEAIEPLLSAVSGSDPEIRTRAIGVLCRLALSLDAGTQEAARQAVIQLQMSNDPAIAGIATARLAGIREELQTVALEKLATLGADVSSLDVRNDFSGHVAASLVIGPEWRGSRQDLEVLRWVTGLTSVTLVGPMIDDALMREICSNNPGIVDLVIRRGSITNASIGHIASLRQISRLQIVFCPIDDGCFEDLVGFARELVARNHQDVQLQFYGTGITSGLCAKILEETGVAVDRRIGAYLGVYYSQGDGPCIITRVAEDSAASRAGIQEGDKITDFEGRPITTADDFRGAVAGFSPGDEVHAIIERDGRTIELTIVLGEFPDDEN